MTEWIHTFNLCCCCCSFWQKSCKTIQKHYQGKNKSQPSRSVLRLNVILEFCMYNWIWFNNQLFVFCFLLHNNCSHHLTVVEQKYKLAESRDTQVITTKCTYSHSLLSGNSSHVATLCLLKLLSRSGIPNFRKDSRKRRPYCQWQHCSKLTQRCGSYMRMSALLRQPAHLEAHVEHRPGIKHL